MPGRYLIYIGLILTAIGIIFTVAPRIPFLGKLPGDIVYRKDNFVLYFPLVTSIIVSIVLSIIFYLLSRR